MWPFTSKHDAPATTVTDTAPAGQTFADGERVVAMKTDRGQTISLDGSFSLDAGLMNLVAGLNTDRDKQSFSFYGIQNQENFKVQIDNAVRGSWLAGRIVNTIAEDMTRAGWSRSWTDREKKPEDDARLTDVESTMEIEQKVADALTWGRQYGGGGILIAVAGQELDFEKPLELDSIKEGTGIALQPFDRHDMNQIGGDLERNVFSPWFGQPKFFTLTNAEQMIPKIHRSRMVLFEGRRLARRSWEENGYWHDSVLTAALSAVKKYDGATGGVASMIFEANVDILTIPGLAELLAQPSGMAKVRSRFLASMMMKSYNQVLLLDGGKAGAAGVVGAETFTQRQINFSGVNEAIVRFMTDVAGAADVPVTRLFGQSPGGLNATGDSDLRNYYDHIAARQKRSLRPQLSYLYEVLLRSVFGEKPEGFSLTFNPLWQISDVDQSVIDKTRSDMDDAYLTMGVIKRETIAKELKKRGTYTEFTDADVALAAEMDASAEELAKAGAKNALAEAAAAKARGTGAAPAGTGTGAPAAAA